MKRIAFSLAAAMLLLTSCMMFKRPPADIHAYAPTQVSASQLYRASYTPVEPIKVGRLHRWRVEVTTLDGMPLTEAQITVDGGMPQHGHGLPTRPQVIASANGDLMIEGMKFNMGGWWVVRLHVDAPQGSDVITFNLKL